MHRLAFSVSACFLISLTLSAQDPRGSIVGNVSDGTGAMVPETVIHATSQTTGVVATGKSSSAGGFNIPFLLPACIRSRQRRLASRNLFVMASMFA